jgi:hypothetical protein
MDIFKKRGLQWSTQEARIFKRQTPILKLFKFHREKREKGFLLSS